jgi:hypothetical protein
VTARKATPAERLAARARGVEEPDVVEVDTTPTAVKHLARMGRAQPEQVKPEGMSAAEWHAARYRERGPNSA